MNGKNSMIKIANCGRIKFVNNKIEVYGLIGC